MRLLVLSYKLAGTDSARKLAMMFAGQWLPVTVASRRQNCRRGPLGCSLTGEGIRFRAAGQGRFRMLPPLVAEMSVCVGLP